ncbi:MAG: hypothetical protein A3G21_21965 [Acidobacteria bacterium RIFCSPLOWO2_12_FULL_66_21]|nr:MAG: hypothetical protein A3G21_21965 [Acidobacteria bacterium RIFCSPLOWO2_12_FULL_66_21]
MNEECSTTLSVEELEDRLELQVLRMPEASCDWSCSSVCAGYICHSVSGSHCSDVYCSEYCVDQQVT